jgi:hypothetical protein
LKYHHLISTIISFDLLFQKSKPFSQLSLHLPSKSPFMKHLLTLFAIVMVSAIQAQTFNNLPVYTQKPPLHGRHWMAITGKPLAAAAGTMIFNKGGNAIDASCAMLAATCTMGCTVMGRRNTSIDLQS